MQKILIIADGIVAKDLLEKVVHAHLTANQYCVVAFREETCPPALATHLECHRFDPTSRSKLATVIDRDYTQVMIVMEQQVEAIEVLEIIRFYKRDLHVVVLDLWGIERNLLAFEAGDQNVSFVRARDLLVARMVDYLPSVPLIGQNIGLGIGEIMEVLVPIGSSYAYRHVSNIEQKNGRIVALYRNNQMILAKPSLMIRPNDSLLLMGNPSILRSMHKAIKSEHGQFPSPYGKNIYCLIDMRYEGQDVKKMVDEALYLHSKLKNIKLVFRIVNPKDTIILQYVKSFLSRDILVEISFRSLSYEAILAEDKRFHIGLIIVSKVMFANSALRDILYAQKKPILKLGDFSIDSIDQTLLLLSDKGYYEQISPVLFDMATQMSHGIMLCDFDPDGSDKESVIEHYENQASLYGKKISLVKNRENPIKGVEQMGRVLQILPFSKEVVESSWMALFFPSIASLHWKLARYPQVFVPIEEKH